MAPPLFFSATWGGHPHGAGFPDEAPRVVTPVGPHGHAAPLPPPFPQEQEEPRLLFGLPGSLGKGTVDDEAVPVLHEDVSGIAELGSFTCTLAGQTGVGIGPRAVGVVAPALAMEVDFGVSAATRGGAISAVCVPFFVSWSEALQGGSGFDQGAVTAEVLPGEEPVGFGLRPYLCMEDLGHSRAEQAVPVLGEARVVPHGLGERQSHEPTKEEVVFDVLAELTFRRNGVEDLQELRPQEVLRRNGDSAPLGIEAGKERTHLA